jgi:hypothetical protein
MAEASTFPGDDSFVLDPPLLPPDPPQYGPITRRLLVRTWLILALMFGIGSALALASDDPAVRAAGLSLVFPGGGFLYIAWPSLFLVTLVGMAFAVLLWWGLSAFFVIPLVIHFPSLL